MPLGPVAPPAPSTLWPAASYPLIAGYLLLARAEQSRLEGRSDPSDGARRPAAWERLAYPFDAGYAHFREAEALLADGSPRLQAEQVPRGAHHTSVMLGAGPLRHEIELLAQRGRLRLEEPADTTGVRTARSSAATALELTQREAEVLALVAEGRTNRQIGQALFIIPRPPASTSPGSWPSSAWPVAARRPRSPTGSASTSNDPGLGRGPVLLAAFSDAGLAGHDPRIPKSRPLPYSPWSGHLRTRSYAL